MAHDSGILDIFLIATIVSVTGCNMGGAPQGDISGEITVGDHPLQVGMVNFEPLEQVAQPRSVPIKGGKYEALAERGLPPGKYLVRISAPDLSRPIPGEATAGGPRSATTYPPLLAESWNTKSEVAIEVRPGKNIFNFRGECDKAPTVENTTTR